MKLFAVALILLTSVILVVSLAYIFVTTRHKEKMSMIEKGLDPQLYNNDQFLPNTLRLGMLLLGVGIGFLGAISIETYVFIGMDNPAIYAGTVLIFGGISQILFYAFYRSNSTTN